MCVPPVHACAVLLKRSLARVSRKTLDLWIRFMAYTLHVRYLLLLWERLCADHKYYLVFHEIP